MKCEERIDKELEGRIKDFKAVIEAEDTIDKLNKIALALTKTILYKLELSWGGPSDYVTFEFDPEHKELIAIKYHFLDWFDGAVREIPHGSKEWEIMENVFYSCIYFD